MREILFRGKRMDNGEWVEGSLVHRTQFYGDPDDCYFILYDGEFHCDYYGSAEVDFKTVGQYTGLTDKNGKKIFTGDILLNERIRTNLLNRPTRFIAKIKEYYLVVDNEYYYSLESHNRANYTDFDEACAFEIIGNIYDNPELFKSDETELIEQDDAE